MGQRICVMNAGKVAQIGKPLEVYRQPADAFVARFLGSPPMNLLEARLLAEGGAVSALLGTARVPLGRWSASALAACGGTVLVGLRPEALGLGDDGPADRVTLAGTVSAVEPLGAETLVLADLGGGAGEMMARVHRDVSFALGDAIALGFDPRALYLFDAASGKAIAADLP